MSIESATMFLAKALLGAALVLLIDTLSRGKNPYLAGIVLLSPTFALLAHYAIGSSRSAADLRATALFGIMGLLPYTMYLLTVWLGAGRFKLGIVLGSALAV